MSHLLETQGNDTDKMNHYERLGAEQDADFQTLKKAFYRRAKECRTIQTIHKVIGIHQLKQHWQSTVPMLFYELP